MDSYDTHKLRWERFIKEHGPAWELKRKFPGAERRAVVVNTQQWPGYPHYHTEINEEPNPFWHPEKATWDHDSTFDDIGKGQRFDVKFFKAKNAAAFVRLVFADWFDPKTHILVAGPLLLPEVMRYLRTFMKRVDGASKKKSHVEPECPRGGKTTWA